MSARRLALVCLMCVVPCWAENNAAVERVAVALVSTLPDNSPVITSMKTTLEALMRRAGAPVELVGPTGVFDGQLIVLNLRGFCDTPRRYWLREPLENLASLATTASSNGEILPFTAVDCDALNRFVGDEVVRLPKKQRSMVYGRAIARLAAHELYHVLSGERGHSSSGLAKASISRLELLTDEPAVFEHLLSSETPSASTPVMEVVRVPEPVYVSEGK